jgi:hypothetical protein
MNGGTYTLLDGHRKNISVTLPIHQLLAHKQFANSNLMEIASSCPLSRKMAKKRIIAFMKNGKKWNNLFLFYDYPNYQSD